MVGLSTGNPIRVIPFRMVRLAQEAPGEQVEDRREEDAEHGRGDHAAHHPGADGLPTGGSGAAGNHQRDHAEDEGEAGHEDGPQTLARRLKGRLADLLDTVAIVMRLVLDREFDNQDRILGG